MRRFGVIGTDGHHVALVCECTVPFNLNVCANARAVAGGAYGGLWWLVWQLRFEPVCQELQVALTSNRCGPQAPGSLVSATYFDEMPLWDKIAELAGHDGEPKAEQSGRLKDFPEHKVIASSSGHNDWHDKVNE
jgi:hypothetical protein